MTPQALVTDLVCRGIEPADLDELIHEVMQAEAPGKDTDDQCAALARQAEQVTATGLLSQVMWLTEHLGDLARVRLALCNFLTLPVTTS